MKRLAWLAAVLLAAGCPKPLEGENVKGGGKRLGPAPKGPRVGGLGEKRLAGKAIDLRAAPDGKIVTALLDAEKPRLEGVPPPMRLGELWAVPTAGGDPVKLGNGVTNMPGGSLFSGDSHWSYFLTGFNAALQTGELDAADLTNLKKERYRLGSTVSYYVPSPDSKLIAFVEDGVLKVGPMPAGPFRQVAGEVATAEFSPDGKRLYARRRVAAAGALLQVSVADDGAQPRKLTDQVGDYQVSEDGRRVVYLARESVASMKFELFVADAGTLKATRVADRVLSFKVSPDGKWVARLQGDSPQQPGELWLGPSVGGAGKKLGERVKDYAFSNDGARLAFRQSYREIQLIGENIEHVGDLMVVGLPEGAPRLVQATCPNYVFSPDGKALAFTATRFKPTYSRDLFLLPGGAQAPVKVKEWLYEYAFSQDSAKLFFRADCTREGRSCWLLAVEVSKPAEPPVQEAEAVFNFKQSEDGARLLYTYAHTQAETYDVGVLNLKTGERKTIEQDVRLPVHFLEKNGSRLAFIVEEKGRQGVYVAGKGVP